MDAKKHLCQGRRLWRWALIAWSLASAAPAGAADPTQSLPRTTIEHIVDAERMPYADFLAGINAFNAGHALAPNATLRFTVIPRSKDIDPGAIELHLVTRNGDADAIEIPVDDHGNFDVPTIDALKGKDAEIRANLPSGTLHWRALVITPGLPDDTRRMGDLRLECEVKEAGGLNRGDIPFIGRLFGSPGASECFTSDQHVFLAPAPLAAVSVDAANPNTRLDAERLGEPSRLYTVFESYLRPRAYSPPLQDATIPDDALVHFTYRDAGIAASSH